MPFKVHIASKSADRYRVYAPVKLLRSPNQEDILKRGTPFPKGAKVRYDGEDILAEDKVMKGDRQTISLPSGVTASRVVFYKGKRDAETVVGSVDVNAAGTLEIDIVEPIEEPKTPQIFDAN